MRSSDDPPLADAEAFVALYREHAEALLVFFARRTLDAEAAADLTAETFAQALASRSRFRDLGDGPAPWLWQMAGANDGRRPTGFGYAYSAGWVAPQVARLTVRFQDGSASDIPLHDGYYLYVVAPANWPAGHRPSILEARDSQGAVVYRAFLYPRQHCQYPGYDPVCHNRALGSG